MVSTSRCLILSILLALLGQRCGAMPSYKKLLKYGEDFKACMAPTLATSTWNYEEAGSIPQIIIVTDNTPSSLAYEGLRQTVAIDYQRYPSAIFYALTSEQVAEAVKCAKSLKLKVSPASGRQGFTGMSVVDKAIVIDLSFMDQISTDSGDATVVAGPGVTNSMLSSYVQTEMGANKGVATGGCSFVGLSGFTLGGGLGFLGHRLGLLCDSLVDVEYVLADGTIVHANADQNQDLFWASCGGGGGTFGIATKFEYRVHDLPNNGALVGFQVIYGGMEAFTQAVAAFQSWYPTSSRLFGIDNPVVLVGPKGPIEGPIYSFEGVYFGSQTDVMDELTRAGLLFPGSQIVYMTPYTSYLEWYLETQLGIWVGYGIGTGLNRLRGALTVNTFAMPWVTEVSVGNTEVINGIVKSQPFFGLPSIPVLGTKVQGGNTYNVYSYQINRAIGPMSAKTIEALGQFFQTLEANCKEGDVAACSIYVSGHYLGGAYADKTPTETAFFWREKLYVLYCGVQTPLMSVEKSVYLAGPALRRAQAYVKKCVSVFSGPDKPVGAYPNYLNPSLANWKEVYWGDNYDRLKSIKKQYDPTGLFDKQYTVGN